MTGLPIGIILLMIVTALIFFGIAHRSLDRLKLSDKGALAVIAGIIIGSFIEIPVSGGRITVLINVGGSLIPFALSVYLLINAGTAREKVRAVTGSVITALIIYALGNLLMRGLPEPAGRFGYLDAIWLFPFIAGITGYLAGRSRRGAFVAATLGVLLYDLGHYVWLAGKGAVARVDIGGAGAFDAVVISGILAVMLSETIGEIRERMAGGPAVAGRPKSLLRALKKPSDNRGEGGVRDE